MNIEKASELLNAKLKETDLTQLSVGDLACLVVLDHIRRNPGQIAATVQGQCNVTKVDDVAPPAGWQCKCYTNGGITSYSFKGPGFPHWVAGGDGGMKNGVPRFTVVHPTTGQVFFVEI